MLIIIGPIITLIMSHFLTKNDNFTFMKFISIFIGLSELYLFLILAHLIVFITLKIMSLNFMAKILSYCCFWIYVF